MRYGDFVQRVARYRASSVTDTCATILWDLFGRSLSPDSQQDLALLRAYGGRISVVAEIHGSELNLPEATGGDLFRLAHDFLETDEGSLELEFQASERLALTEGWRRSPLLGRYALPEECMLEATQARTIARMMRAQWEVTSVHSHALARGWELVRRVHRRAPNLDPIGYLKRALGMEPHVFLRSAFALLSMCIACRGRFDLRESPIGESLSARWGFSSTDLLFVADRMSLHREDLLRWESDSVDLLPELLRRYAPTPLIRSPFIQRRADASAPTAERGRYVAPCPGSLQLAIQNWCLHTIREAPGRAGPFAVELGRAVEDYLFDFLATAAGQENVTRVDSVTGGGRRADIIVALGSRAFVVESKSLLGSSRAKAVAEVSGSIDIWERVYGAFEQCACTVKDQSLWRSQPKLSAVSEVISLVCFDESLTIEGTTFGSLSACTGIAEALGVGRIETLTLQYLESVVGWYGLEGLFDLISEKWASGKRGDDLSAFIASKHRGPSRKQGKTPVHLVDAIEEILPGRPH